MYLIDSYSVLDKGWSNMVHLRYKAKRLNYYSSYSTRLCPTGPEESCSINCILQLGCKTFFSGLELSLMKG